MVLTAWEYKKDSLVWVATTGILYIATNFAWTVYAKGDGTNEDETKTALEALTYQDLWVFKDFKLKFGFENEQVIESHRTSFEELSREADLVSGFSVMLQQALDTANLALMLGQTVQIDGVNDIEMIVAKMQRTTIPYGLYKFVTEVIDGTRYTLYFVKSALKNAPEIWAVALKNGFDWYSFEFEVAKTWNFAIYKETAAA